MTITKLVEKVITLVVAMALLVSVFILDAWEVKAQFTALAVILLNQLGDE